jgi:hypothetical protein
MEPKNSPEPECWQEVPSEDHRIHPSRALIAYSDDAEVSIVLEYVGDTLEEEIENLDSRQTCDLGLNVPEGQEDPPLPTSGLCIWEGEFVSKSVTSPETGYDYDTEARGSFRPLTDEEWEKVKRGEALFIVDPPPGS